MYKLTANFSRLALGLAVVTPGFINAFAAGSGVALEKSEMHLRVTWPLSAEESGVAVFSLSERNRSLNRSESRRKGRPRPW